MSAPNQIIERLTRLLHDEVSAIAAGKLEKVRELYPEKAALLEELEEVNDLVEDKLAEGGNEAGKLREQIQELHVLLKKDHSLLDRMTQATARAAREVANIRERHGLGGLYESTGTLRKGDVAGSQQVDQSI